MHKRDTDVAQHGSLRNVVAKAAKGATVEVNDSDSKSADLQLIQLKSKASQAE